MGLNGRGESKETKVTYQKTPTGLAYKKGFCGHGLLEKEVRERMFV
jgi:hypothetical protein